MNKILYAKDAKDNIRVWMVTAHDTGLTIEHGLLSGELQSKEERIVVGDQHKSKDQRIYSRYLSRINAQIDKGYLDDLERVKKSKRVNGLGFVRPMLAQVIKKVKGIDYGQAFYQHKYDGNRCLLTKQKGKVIAYSRNGKAISTIRHITSQVELEEGQTIDGELYCHGVALQTINSWKSQVETAVNLSLRVYDIVENRPYIDRLGALQSLVLGDNASVVPTVRVHSEESLDELLGSSLADGYEGGILRWGEAGYQDGKRSKSLAKIKVFEDDEFKVYDIVPSKDGWAILYCIMKDGNTFAVSAPGTMDDKYEIMRDKESYIGKKVNVRYANLTEDGIPFHPVATMFRDKGEE